MVFTIEEQNRWANALVDTWHTIAADVEEGFRLEAKWSGKKMRVTAPLLVEIVCDTNRLETYGGLTREEGAVLTAIYATQRFQRWARSIMRGYTFEIDPPPKPRTRKLPKQRTYKTPKAQQTYWEKAGYTTYTGPNCKPIRINYK